MSNGPRRRRPSAAAALAERPRQKLSELKVTLRIAPPDADKDEDGNLVPALLEIDLGAFTLAERQLAKAALTKFVQPPDAEDVVIVHAWVVWRRTHPASSLDAWMNGLTFAEVLDGLSYEPGRTQWDTTPEGYDPEA